MLIMREKFDGKWLNRRCRVHGTKTARSVGVGFVRQSAARSLNLAHAPDTFQRVAQPRKQ